MSGSFHIPEDREWDDIRLEDLYRQFGGLGKCSDFFIVVPAPGLHVAFVSFRLVRDSENSASHVSQSLGVHRCIPCAVAHAVEMSGQRYMDEVLKNN